MQFVNRFIQINRIYNTMKKHLGRSFYVAMLSILLSRTFDEEQAEQIAKRGKAATAAPKSPEVLTDGLWWEGRGVVERVLPDDDTPPRHQRFFLRDDRGRSLFFAHNVDEAPRVPDLREGDEISFRGEWRDNDMGGAMHWTHRAGSGRRKGGWLERDGVRYE